MGSNGKKGDWVCSMKPGLAGRKPFPPGVAEGRLCFLTFKKCIMADRCDIAASLGQLEDIFTVSAQSIPDRALAMRALDMFSEGVAKMIRAATDAELGAVMAASDGRGMAKAAVAEASRRKGETTKWELKTGVDGIVYLEQWPVNWHRTVVVPVIGIPDSIPAEANDEDQH